MNGPDGSTGTYFDFAFRLVMVGILVFLLNLLQLIHQLHLGHVYLVFLQEASIFVIGP